MVTLRIICFSLVFTLCLMLDAKGEQLAQAVDLELIPEVCISDKPQGICYDAIKVNWRSQASLSLCLFVSDAEKALICWQNQSTGSYHYTVHSNQSLLFRLRAAGTLDILAEKTLSIFKVKQRKQRRRRHAWSLF